MKDKLNQASLLRPVTKEEIDQLKEQRSVPELEPAYTIGGDIEQAVHANKNSRAERQIETLESILNKYQNRSRDEFNINSDEYLRKQLHKTMDEKQLNEYFRSKHDHGIER
jgi:hypothetical protein